MFRAPEDAAVMRMVLFIFTDAILATDYLGRKPWIPHYGPIRIKADTRALVLTGLM